MKKTSSTQDLFDEFEKLSKDDWIEKVQSDLKGQSIDNLLWKSLENIEIQPFYTSEDTRDLGPIEYYQHSFSNEDPPANSPRYWTNYELIAVVDDKSANKAALNALKMGADGILFDINHANGLPQLDILLNQVLEEDCHVSFQSQENTVAFIQDYIENLKKSGRNPENIHGFYRWDAIAAWTLGNDLGENHFQELAGLFKQTAPFQGFKHLTITSQALERSGATLVQEVAFTLNTAIDYIDKLSSHGLEPQQIFDGMQFSLSVGGDFFMEIAKFRAFRILLHQIALAYGLNEFHPGKIRIHATSSRWNKTLLDINNNMLRNTTEAMAAIIGGCDSIQVAPHDDLLQNSPAFSRRIARNISNILKDEAYLDKVVDPAAGSYYVENLTHEFIKAAWAIFHDVEKEGGFIKSFEANKIQTAIKTSRTKKFSQIANRRSVIVGVNQYPDKNEKIASTVSKEAKKEGKENLGYELLVPHRASEQFETLKMKTLQFASQQLNGNIPKVFVATLGNSSLQKIRVGFIDTFFASAGFDIKTSSPGSSFEECVDEAAAADEKIVVMCGSNEDYQEKACDFAKQFKLKEPGKMLWLAGAPNSNKEDLLQAGLDGFIHIGSDVIATMEDIQSFLGIDKGREVKLI